MAGRLAEAPFVVHVVDGVDEDFEQWRRLWAARGQEPPPRSVAATATGRPMFPYFNSGVLAVPRELWESERAPVAPHKRFYSEQWALMSTLRHIPWSALPPR